MQCRALSAVGCQYVSALKVLTPVFYSVSFLMAGFSFLICSFSCSRVCT